MTEKQRAAIQHIKDTDDLFLVAEDLGPAMGCDPQWVRIMARKDRLPFPHKPRGKKKIVFPRVPVLQYFKEAYGIE